MIVESLPAEIWQKKNDNGKASLDLVVKSKSKNNIYVLQALIAKDLTALNDSKGNNFAYLLSSHINICKNKEDRRVLQDCFNNLPEELWAVENYKGETALEAGKLYEDKYALAKQDLHRFAEANKSLLSEFVSLDKVAQNASRFIELTDQVEAMYPELTSGEKKELATLKEQPECQGNNPEILQEYIEKSDNVKKLLEITQNIEDKTLNMLELIKNDKKTQRTFAKMNNRDLSNLASRVVKERLTIMRGGG